MHEYAARAFDSSLVRYIERDVLRTTSKGVIIDYLFIYFL